MPDKDDLMPADVRSAVRIYVLLTIAVIALTAGYTATMTYLHVTDPLAFAPGAEDALLRFCDLAAAIFKWASYLYAGILTMMSFAFVWIGEPLRRWMLPMLAVPAAMAIHALIPVLPVPALVAADVALTATGLYLGWRIHVLRKAHDATFGNHR